MFVTLEPGDVEYLRRNLLAELADVHQELQHLKGAECLDELRDREDHIRVLLGKLEHPSDRPPALVPMVGVRGIV